MEASIPGAGETEAQIYRIAGLEGHAKAVEMRENWTSPELHERYHRLLLDQIRYEGDLYDARGRRVRPRETVLQWRRRQVRERIYAWRRWLANWIEP